MILNTIWRVKLLLSKTGKKYTINSLSGKLIRESITLKETLQILDILGYHLDIKKNC